MKEGEAEFEVDKGVFYNPHMEYCRTLSSKIVGAIEEDLNILDAFTASGIRGLRYKLENKNVKSLIALDYSEKAVKNAKKNISKNGTVIKDEITHFLNTQCSESINFIELDPFGSPAPYIYDSIRCLSKFHKKFYLSITATDTAVLCGAHKNACLKNYNAKPLNNFSKHENGLRILIGYAAKIGTQFNLGMKVIFSFSKRHYFKTILKFEVGDKKALKTVEEIGFIDFSEIYPAIPQNKPISMKQYAGPAYLGSIFDKNILKKIDMKDKFFNRIKDEVINGPKNSVSYIPMPYLSEINKSACPKISWAIEKLKEVGFKASRTHFDAMAIRTNAGFDEISRLIFD